MPRYTKRYVRYRIRSPSEFKKDSFRTDDIGRSGYHKLILGELKNSKRYVVQAVLVQRDYADEPSVKKETKDIVSKARKYK